MFPTAEDKLKIASNPDIWVICTGVPGSDLVKIRFNKNELLNRMDITEMIQSLKYIRAVFEIGLKPAKDILEFLREEDIRFKFQKSIWRVIHDSKREGFLVKDMIQKLEDIVASIKHQYKCFPNNNMDGDNSEVPF